MMSTANLVEFVESFENSMIEGDFSGFNRTVTDEETRINAVYEINNQSVTHSIIETENGTQMCIKVDGETVSQDYKTPDETIHTIARNTISTIDE